MVVSHGNQHRDVCYDALDIQPLTVCRPWQSIMLRHFRIRLSELLIGTALAGLSCAALVNANSTISSLAFLALLVAWMIATAVSVNPGSQNRPFWLAFLIASLFTHYHVGYGGSFNDSLQSTWELLYGPEPVPADPFGDPFSSMENESRFLATVTLIELREPDDPPTGPSKAEFVKTGGSLVSLWIGLLTGLLARAVARSKQESDSDLQRSKAAHEH